MPWQELAYRTGTATAAVSALLIAYTWLLLWAGERFSKGKRIAITLLGYLVLAALLGGALLWVLLSAGEAELGQSWAYLLVVLSCWLIIVLPGFLYIQSKLERLRSYGYFLKAGAAPTK
ncbi:MAG TPA: hypothetical protein VM845_00755 [Burkholderiaceae bacterium]|nr:hypothetical protein [Burkholderiaceae bacterium]